jgi:hypothetical protein
MLKWVVYVHNHQICFDVLTLVLASVVSYYFNFVGEFYTAFQINVWFAFWRNDYHLGRLLHVENVPASNARRNEYKTLDVTFKEGLLWL